MTDDAERRVAAEIERSHPYWMVLWGYHSRMFWAFPHFQVPKGIIVSARDRDGLLADMATVELWATSGAHLADGPGPRILAGVAAGVPAMHRAGDSRSGDAGPFGRIRP